MCLHQCFLLFTSGWGDQEWSHKAHCCLYQALASHSKAACSPLTHPQQWQQAKLDMPGSMLLAALQRFRHALTHKAGTSPDITTQPSILDHLQKLEGSLQDLVDDQARQADEHPEPSLPQIPCPECDAMAAHDFLPPRAACTPTKFVPRLHACGGLPRCQLCLRTFYRWQNLRHHIESGACEKLGGESLSKHPPKNADAQASDASLPCPPPQLKLISWLIVAFAICGLLGSRT